MWKSSLPALKVFPQLKIFLVKKGQHFASVAGVNEEEVGIGWQKIEEEGDWTAPYLDKEARFQKAA